MSVGSPDDSLNENMSNEDDSESENMLQSNHHHHYSQFDYNALDHQNDPKKRKK